MGIILFILLDYQRVIEEDLQNSFWDNFTNILLYLSVLVFGAIIYGIEKLIKYLKNKNERRN